MGGDTAAFMMSEVCGWVMPSDGWCWVKRTVMGRQRSEKPLPQQERRGRGRESGMYAVVFSDCKAELLSFYHDWTSARWLCIHYGGAALINTWQRVAWHKMPLSVLEEMGKGTHEEISYRLTVCPYSPLVFGLRCQRWGCALTKITCL